MSRFVVWKQLPPSEERQAGGSVVYHPRFVRYGEIVVADERFAISMARLKFHISHPLVERLTASQPSGQPSG